MNRTNRRVNSGSVKNQNKRYYVDGSAVPKLEPVKKKPKRRKQTSRVSSRAKRNRAMATQMSKGYVLFLGLICLVTLFVCVNYLQSKSQLTNQTMELATLESQLSKLKADNDAYYNSTLASVDMEQIKNDAINRLGLHYAAESQIVYYDTSGSSYVRQYQDVPESK